MKDSILPAFVIARELVIDTEIRDEQVHMK